MIRFQNPLFFILLVVVPVLVYLFLRKGSIKHGTIKYSNLDIIKKVNTKRASRARTLLFIIRMAAVILIIIGLARPQSGSKEEEVITEGIDIILAMDVSTSMRAEDFKPKNRLQAAKIVAQDFIKGQKGRGNVFPLHFITRVAF